MRKIILFELNEVPFKVIDYYCEKFPKSSLAKALKVSRQIETITHDEGELHPWSTWPTVHRGVTNDMHQIKDLGEDTSEIDKKYPPLWQMLIDHKISTGLFSSLHTYPLPSNVGDYDFYVPDPFAEGSACHPKALTEFQAFSLAMSRRSVRNIDLGISIKSMINLGLKLPFLGLTTKTIIATVKQLVEERISPSKATRRRTLQSVIAFDLFFKLLKKNKPQFVTCFTNHVASTLHRYWAATFPQDYEQNNLPSSWLDTYKDEIDFVMHSLDGFLSKIIPFVDENPDYKLVVLSSMGQKATKAEVLNTELGVSDLDKLLTSLGVHENSYQKLPAMYPQYNVNVNEESAAHFKLCLDKLKINGEPMVHRQKGALFFSLNFGHVNLAADAVTVNDEPVTLESVGLKNMKIDEQSSGTAYHVPEGSMFVYDPQDKSEKKERIKTKDTRQVAPSILENFNIAVPDYMTKERIDAILDNDYSSK